MRSQKPFAVPPTIHTKAHYQIVVLYTARFGTPQRTNYICTCRSSSSATPPWSRYLCPLARRSCCWSPRAGLPETARWHRRRVPPAPRSRSKSWFVNLLAQYLPFVSPSDSLKFAHRHTQAQCTGLKNWGNLIVYDNEYGTDAKKKNTVSAQTSSILMNPSTNRLATSIVLFC